jgi:hypothetical protein
MKRALVLSLICVLGLGFSGLAASLTGFWDTDVTIDPTKASFADAIGLTSKLSVTYTVGDWAFTSLTTLSELGWTAQEFDVAGVLGAFTLDSTLKFDPTPPNPSFTSWNTVASVSIAGVSFSADFTLDSTGTSLDLIASGTAGDVTVTGTLTLGSGDGCDFDFNEVVIDLGFPFCCADVWASIAFDCYGFEYANFGTNGIVVPLLPYLTIDAEVDFTIQTKSFVLTPHLDFGDFACFDLGITFATSGGTFPNPLVIGDISISSISLTCDIGAVTFTGVTDYNGGLGPTGYKNYWEYYSIATKDDGCCGPFSFDLSIYFLDGGVALFDVGLIDANMSLQIASQFTFNMGLMIDVNAGAFTQWTVGFLVEW